MSGGESEDRDNGALSASIRLDLQGDKDGHRQHPRKRKSKVATPVTQTLDLNIPLGVSSALVSASLVNSRVSQLDTDADSGGGSMIETLKKQKHGTSKNNAGSMAVADSNPHQAQ